MTEETATVSPNGHPATTQKPNRLLGVLKNLKPMRFAAPPAAEPLPAESDYGMHGVTKNVDVWFDYHVDEVRKEAAQLASEWAQAAIPKTDVAYDEIPPETILAKRCMEVLRRWRERLVNKVQDAINQLTGRIGVTLVDYRDGIATLKRTRTSIIELEGEAKNKTATLSEADASAEIHPFLLGWGKWVLIAALVFADWVANVPVFYELLPKDAAADRALQQLLESTEAYPVIGGVMRLGLRFLHSPEASILALTVVLFLMIFGHKLGESLREVVSFRDEDAPTISKQLRARRRQFVPALLISTIGATLLVFVLYNARGMLVDSSQARLQNERTTLVQAEQARDAAFARPTATDDERAALETAVGDQRAVVRQAEEGVRYATNLARANVAIMVLNIVLALSAALDRLPGTQRGGGRPAGESAARGHPQAHHRPIRAGPADAHRRAARGNPHHRRPERAGSFCLGVAARGLGSQGGPAEVRGADVPQRQCPAARHRQREHPGVPQADPHRVAGDRFGFPLH